MAINRPIFRRGFIDVASQLSRRLPVAHPFPQVVRDLDLRLHTYTLLPSVQRQDNDLVAYVNEPPVTTLPVLPIIWQSVLRNRMAMCHGAVNDATISHHFRRDSAA